MCMFYSDRKLVLQRMYDPSVTRTPLYYYYVVASPGNPMDTLSMLSGSSSTCTVAGSSDNRGS